MLITTARSRFFLVVLASVTMLVWMSRTADAALISYVTTPQYDVNKYWAGNIPAGVDPHDSSDSLMCWAATVSNVLMYTRWGYDRDNDGTIELYDDLYHEFLWAFPNTGGDGGTGYSHYLNTYWPAYSWGDYFHQYSDDSLMLPRIDDWLHLDYGIYLSITTGASLGHAITAWGFEYDNVTQAYTRLAITDSDDHLGGLQWYHLNLAGGRYYLDDYSGGDWYIRRIDAFESRVPEPSTLLLLGSGFLAIIRLARHRPSVTSNAPEQRSKGRSS